MRMWGNSITVTPCNASRSVVVLCTSSCLYCAPLMDTMLVVVDEEEEEEEEEAVLVELVAST